MTDKPFGVNVLLMSPFADEAVSVTAAKKIPVMATGAGNPWEYIPSRKTAEIKIIPVISSCACAAWFKSGADAVNNRKQGIGRGMAAAFIPGAAGIQTGTRFLAVLRMHCSSES